MSEKEDKKFERILYFAAFLIILPSIIGVIVMDISGHDTEKIRTKIEEHLYEKYGEEFIVDQIGTRTSRDEEFFQARIYPESIIGTNKEGDEYYYASASVDKEPLGRLGDVGDSYSYVVRNMDVEEFLLPKTRKIFGDRCLLKVDVQHKVTGDGSWWAGYKSKSLQEMREAIEEDPERNRIELDLDVYVFDRIDDEEEKEQRREDIFEYIQFLKEEELFEYLEMRVVFVDERVLADSYSDYGYDLYFGDKEKVYIEEEDKTVELPQEELREEMSKKLQQEIDEMSEEELIANMNELQKEELSYSGIGKYNIQYFSRIYSPNMLKERYPTYYEENPESIRNYDSTKDVKLPINLEYMY